MQLHGQVSLLSDKVKELESELTKYEDLAERAEQLAETVEVSTCLCYHFVCVDIQLCLTTALFIAGIYTGCHIAMGLVRFVLQHYSLL